VDAAGENTPISFLNETFTDKNPQTGATTTVDGSKLTTTTITLGEGSQTALIVNKKLGILPATGGSGIIFYLVAGGLLAGTAAILINKDRKRSIA
jgi:LPXTG-motif cell wall-anchored protein